MNIFKHLLGLDNGEIFTVKGYTKEPINLTIYNDSIYHYNKDSVNPIGDEITIGLFKYILNRPDSISTYTTMTKDDYDLIKVILKLYPNATSIERTSNSNLYIVCGDEDPIAISINPKLFKCILVGRGINIKALLTLYPNYPEDETSNEYEDSKINSTNTGDATTYTTPFNHPACTGCKSNPANGGTGICNCTLGSYGMITC